MQFRKKPIIIDAIQYLGQLDHHTFPEGMCREDMKNCSLVRYAEDWFPHIHTLEGVMRVSDQDWVIKGVNGEFYPCKPDIFEKTYEAVTK